MHFNAETPNEQFIRFFKFCNLSVSSIQFERTFYLSDDYRSIRGEHRHDRLCIGVQPFNINKTKQRRVKIPLAIAERNGNSFIGLWRIARSSTRRWNRNAAWLLYRKSPWTTIQIVANIGCVGERGGEGGEGGKTRRESCKGHQIAADRGYLTIRLPPSNCTLSKPGGSRVRDATLPSRIAPNVITIMAMPGQPRALRHRSRHPRHSCIIA